MTYASDGYWFEYSGGNYIDVHIEGEEVPFTCINIVGQNGKKLIKPGRSAFVTRCEKWIIANLG